MSKRPSILDKLEKELPEQPQAVAPPVIEKAPAQRQGIQKTTIYPPVDVYERLREIAYVERRKINDLVMEGINRLIESRGHAERAPDGRH